MAENHRQHEADGDDVDDGIVGIDGGAGRRGQQQQSGNQQPEIPDKNADGRKPR